MTGSVAPSQHTSVTTAMFIPARRFRWIAILALTAWPAVGMSQTIRGKLISRESSLPVANALVILTDTLDHPLAQTSTLASGVFALRFGSVDFYRVTVLRIGYAPWQSGHIHLDRGEVTELTIELPAERIVLPDDIVVRGAGACRTDPESGAATALLMEEARKAFALAQETLTGPRMRFRTSSYLRTLDPVGVVLEETTAANEPLRHWPIESAPADSLAVWGFVRPPTHLQRAAGRGPTYYGPDGTVLFSPWFLGSHCYGLTRDQQDSHLVGLTFQPFDRNANPGIEGTLWVDEASLALDRLEYAYVHLPSWVPRASTGGQLEFSQLPLGGWVVRRWWIRAPIADRPVGLGPTRLAGFQESGGSVVEVVDSHGQHLLWLDGRE